MDNDSSAPKQSDSNNDIGTEGQTATGTQGQQTDAGHSYSRGYQSTYKQRVASHLFHIAERLIARVLLHSPKNLRNRCVRVEV